jgi:hypothetical protein
MSFSTFDAPRFGSTKDCSVAKDLAAVALVNVFAFLRFFYFNLKTGNGLQF